MKSNVEMKLKEFGLTSYEAKAYLALVENGTMTARKICEKTGIPYAKIYEVLSRLERKGWIIIEKEKQNKYKPKPPVEAVKETSSKMIEEIRNYGRQIIRELQPIYDRKGVKERPEVIILRGTRMIIEKADSAFEKASKEIEIAIPRSIYGFYLQLGGRIREIMRRGVNVKVLADSNHEELLKKIIEAGVEVALKEKMFGGGIIVDDEEALILLGEEKLSPIAIWSNHGELVKVAKIYFEHLWRDAKKIS